MRALLLMLIAVFLLLLAGNANAAKPLIVDLAERKIEVDSSFTGDKILLFGVASEPGEILVVLRGPERRYVVRKKERVGGVWVNTSSMVFNDFPYVFSVANNQYSSRLNARSSDIIGVDGALSYISNAGISDEMQKAMIRHKVESNLFSAEVAELSFMGDTLFSTYLNFPAKIQRGIYTAEVYLSSNGNVIAMESIPIEVRKRGFDAFVSQISQRAPAIYGFLCVILALTSGWFASFVFSRL